MYHLQGHFQVSIVVAPLILLTVSMLKALPSTVTVALTTGLTPGPDVGI